MKPLDKSYRQTLNAIATAVRKALTARPPAPGLRIVSETAWRTNTYGWACTVARLRGTRACDFELWLDRFATPSRPVLSVCFWASSVDKVREVAQANDRTRAPLPDLDLSSLTPRDNGHQRMRSPLPAAAYGRPLFESYQEPFLTVYLEDTTGRRARLAGDAVAKLAPLIGAASGALTSNLPEDPFEGVERRLVRKHLSWERSRRLAREVKIRDGYICQVCRFSFGAFYGPVGVGYAEAHHRVPLAALRAKTTRLRATDLVTVCANCHAMLHRLPTLKDPISVLRRSLGKAGVRTVAG